MTLYGRRARLLAGSLEVESEGDRGLRMTFNVVRSLTRSKNSASVEIFNLAEDTRARLSEHAEARADTRLFLEAGYEDTVAALFCGDRAWIAHHHRGVDWVTRVRALDGVELGRARVSKAFGPGATGEDMVKEARKAAGLVVKELRAGASVKAALKKTSYDLGKVVNARALELVREVAEDAGLEASVQDCDIALLTKKQAIDAPGIVLAPDSGLVGSPEPYRDPERPTDLLIRGTSLLQPGIVPGRRLVLESNSLSGTFKVLKVEHRGDTHGAAWHSNFEARAT